MSQGKTRNFIHMTKRYFIFLFLLFVKEAGGRAPNQADDYLLIQRNHQIDNEQTEGQKTGFPEGSHSVRVYNDKGLDKSSYETFNTEMSTEKNLEISKNIDKLEESPTTLHDISNMSSQELGLLPIQVVSEDSTTDLSSIALADSGYLTDDDDKVTPKKKKQTGKKNKTKNLNGRELAAKIKETPQKQVKGVTTMDTELTCKNEVPIKAQSTQKTQIINDTIETIPRIQVAVAEEENLIPSPVTTLTDPIPIQLNPGISTGPSWSNHYGGSDDIINVDTIENGNDDGGDNIFIEDSVTTIVPSPSPDKDPITKKDDPPPSPPTPPSPSPSTTTPTSSKAKSASATLDPFPGSASSISSSPRPETDFNYIEAGKAHLQNLKELEGGMQTILLYTAIIAFLLIVAYSVYYIAAVRRIYRRRRRVPDMRSKGDVDIQV
jgi:hypothetical protein